MTAFLNDTLYGDISTQASPEHATYVAVEDVPCNDSISTKRSTILTDRWYPLRPHKQQSEFLLSQKRFNVSVAGRRSGKTECAKRRLIRKVLMRRKPFSAYYIVGAPTYDQVKRIYWEDIKLLLPPWAILGRVQESGLTIRTITGAIIRLMGMDRPERVEGAPIDYALLDEYDDMDEKAFTMHIRPGLSDTRGSCDFVGAPEGLKNLKKIYDEAILPQNTDNWSRFHWPSSDIMDPEELEFMRRSMDPYMFDQECNASFVTFGDLIYYPFKRGIHATNPIYQLYDPDSELNICFDFNVAPGVAGINQEIKGWTGWIDCVHIPRGSNTERVCDVLIDRYGKTHRGKVTCYGDATGGADGSAKVAGSDWDIIRRKLTPSFGNRLDFEVPRQNPREKQRINSVNARLQNTLNEVRMYFDPAHCEPLIKDMESVTVLEGTSGQIDKKTDDTKTHHSDYVGYYVHRKYPLAERAEFKPVT